MAGRSRIAGQLQRLYASSCHPSGTESRLFPHAMPTFLGTLGSKFGFPQPNSLPSSLKFTSSIHSIGPKEFERDPNKNSGFFDTPNRRFDDMDRRQPIEPGQNPNYFENMTRRLTDIDRNRTPNELGQNLRPFPSSEPGRQTSSMNFMRGIMRNNNFNENPRYGVEQNADVVHIKIMRNNTFVTVTDSKGNKKMGASAGSLAEMKGGPKVSKYSAEATAEHVGRVAKSMGLKSVVMKINGFTFFKKKKLAILSFRDGYTGSRSDKNPIVYIEDTTRKPHNGCRLRKQRRV